MKVLFAVNDEKVSEAIIKKYQQMYKEIILSKNVYYFNAIVKELQKDKTYDRVVISEDLEPFTNNNYETIDNFIFEKLDNISDEATTLSGDDIPIILIATDRRNKTDNLLTKIFGIGVYSALIGQDRSIEEVCKLIQKPRSKKEAKAYYNLDENEVGYKPENEDNVSEAEIQNILTYYKHLGRDEDRYVESFDSIAAQYTDQQLKVIIKFLPLNVKAVLEANSSRYQQLMSFGGQKINNQQTANKTKINNNTAKAISNDGIKVESIAGSEKKMTRPVIIPTANSVRKIQKVEARPIIQEEDATQSEMPEMIEEENIQEPVIEQTKKGRGRPKKVEKQENTEKPKKQRGRPKKTQEEDEEEQGILPGFEDIEEQEVEDISNNILPNVDDEEDSFVGFEDFGKEDNNREDVNVLPDFDYEDEEDVKSSFDSNESYDETPYETTSDRTEIENYHKQSNSLQGLLTSDKKVVAFIGTSKNGTSFLVNNLAEMLSNQGIRTAILDLTDNKNSYYIYTKNEESLRKITYEAMQNLAQGVAEGIKVNNNLDVYTSLPGERQDDEQYQNILETLVQNYSLVLLDCDFKTDTNYLSEAQEIYLVQSMDVLTIQPLTAYLRDLKTKGILEQGKLKAVINKYTRVKGISEKAIIGGMAFYNDPSMSYMTELFNRETIPYCTIPFDMQVYEKYLEALVNCNISINGYTKDFLNSLRKLGNMVYPLISGSNSSKYNKFN